MARSALEPPSAPSPSAERGAGASSRPSSPWSCFRSPRLRAAMHQASSDPVDPLRCADSAATISIPRSSVNGRRSRLSRKNVASADVILRRRCHRCWDYRRCICSNASRVLTVMVIQSL